VSSFGDFDVDDAYDTEPADPEQVARKLHALRLEHDLDDLEWNDLAPSERTALVQVVVRLLAWLRRQGAHP
jgi:hypothetical protein